MILAKTWRLSKSSSEIDVAVGEEFKPTSRPGSLSDLCMDCHAKLTTSSHAWL